MTVVGLGLDVVEIPRMAQALDRTPRFAARVFSETERRAAAQRPDPVQFLAARFAGKEATLKALGWGIFAVPLTSIELIGGHGTAPRLSLSGAAAERAAELGVEDWLVSLTHTAAIAAAVVVGTGSPHSGARS